MAPIVSTEAAAIFDELARFASEMDLADGCLVILQRRIPASLIVTADHRDFATYRSFRFAYRGLFELDAAKFMTLRTHRS